MPRRYCSRCGGEYDGATGHGPGTCGPVPVSLRDLLDDLNAELGLAQTTTGKGHSRHLSAAYGLAGRALAVLEATPGHVPADLLQTVREYDQAGYHAGTKRVPNQAELGRNDAH